MAERRILVVGGSGVIGRRLVPRLVAGGHRATVLAHRDESVRGADALGWPSVRGDIFAPASLLAAMAGHDIVVNLATRIPKSFPGRPEDFAENDRIRTEGTRNLLAAAESAGVRRVVLQSIIWVHGDQGEAWLDETAALKPSRLTRSAIDLEQQGSAFAARTGASVITLRCGSLYAADAWHTREVVRRLRARLLPIVSGGHNFQGFIHADDLASAFAAATLSERTGAYLVTDNEPARMGEFLGWLARSAGASAPLHLPGFMARLALGAEMEAAYGSSVRCRNVKARTELGWEPKYASYREGYAEVLPGIR